MVMNEEQPLCDYYFVILNNNNNNHQLIVLKTKLSKFVLFLYH